VKKNNYICLLTQVTKLNIRGKERESERERGERERS
jgi:hypothetical protein